MQLLWLLWLRVAHEPVGLVPSDSLFDRHALGRMRPLRGLKSIPTKLRFGSHAGALMALQLAVLRPLHGFLGSLRPRRIRA